MCYTFDIDVLITGKFHATLLKEKLFPLLQEKWAEGDIFIQTNNARPQVGKQAKDAHSGRLKATCMSLFTYMNTETQPGEIAIA